MGPEARSARAEETRAKLARLGLAGVRSAVIAAVDTRSTPAERARLSPDQGRAIETITAQARAGRSPIALLAGPDARTRLVAAKTVAADLSLPLLRVDVSRGTIGETEKNLEALFAVAGGSEAVLLFDEADALFGKRSGIADAHDRYSHQEVSRLRDQLEGHDGVTLLVTNLRCEDAGGEGSRFDEVVAFPRGDGE